MAVTIHTDCGISVDYLASDNCCSVRLLCTGSRKREGPWAWKGLG